MKTSFSLLVTSLLILASTAFGGSLTANNGVAIGSNSNNSGNNFNGNVSINSYVTANASTLTYLSLFASTPLTVKQAYVCDSSGSVTVLAVGPAGSEVPLATLPTSACVLLPFAPYIPAGSRISIKSGLTTGLITQGFGSVSLLP